jgi:hypothetical protein
MIGFTSLIIEEPIVDKNTGDHVIHKFNKLSGSVSFCCLFWFRSLGFSVNLQIGMGDKIKC